MQFMIGKHYKRFSVQYALLFTILIFYTGSVVAEGSIAAGKEKAVACQVCHGTGGHSTKPTYPVLAGQHAQYIQKQLRAFKAGTRKDPIMNGMAAPLSEQDIEDVAAFFQSNR
jgi:cytochrome c553